MRVLFTADPEIPVPPVEYGGVQRLVAGLIEHYREKSIEVGLVAHPESVIEGGTLYPFHGLRSQNLCDTLKNGATLYRAVKHFEPDILHSFSRLLYLVPLMMRDITIVMTYGRYPGARQVSLATKLFSNRIGFSGCSDHIVRLGQLGGGTWKRVYNFVELSECTYKDTVSDDAPLVFLSRLEKIKGVHTAIDIALASKRKLIIAGNRPELSDALQYWSKEVEPRVDGKQIQYIGPVDNKIRDKLLGEAAALVVPIEWEEPFGMVFIEALACGTPVISTKRGALPEIVQHGTHGFLIDSLSDGVQAVEALSSIKRSDCRARVEQCFTLPIIASQYLDFYDEITRKRESLR